MRVRRCTVQAGESEGVEHHGGEREGGEGLGRESSRQLSPSNCGISAVWHLAKTIVVLDRIIG